MPEFPSSISWLAKLKLKASSLYHRFFRRDAFLAEHRLWLSVDGDRTLRLNYPLNSSSVVFDVGAYRGDFASQIRSCYDCRVWLFEPISDFHRQCVQRFSGDEKVFCLPYGLGSVSEELEMHIDHDASGALNPSSRAMPTENVKIVAFADALRQLGVEQIDLLKVNIEGGEFALLRHLLETNLIDRVLHLQVQFHNFVPDAGAQREWLREQIAKTHVQQWNFPFIWESWKRLN